MKPDNFVVGLDTTTLTSTSNITDEPNKETVTNNTGKIFLIDFGLAKRYRRPGSLVHIPPRDKKNLTGTARYASIHTHKGLEQSRRDDLESLGYVLVYFLKGQLPWQGLKAINKNDKYGRIFEKKFTTPPEVLCDGLPSEFVTYFMLVRALKFEERPDYDTLRRLFRAIQVREHFKKDGLFDWTIKKLQEERSEASSKSTNTPVAIRPPFVSGTQQGQIGFDPFTLLDDRVVESTAEETNAATFKAPRDNLSFPVDAPPLKSNITGSNNICGNSNMGVNNIVGGTRPPPQSFKILQRPSTGLAREPTNISGPIGPPVYLPDPETPVKPRRCPPSTKRDVNWI